MKNSIKTFLVLVLASSTMQVSEAFAQTETAPAKAPEPKKASPEDELIFQSMLSALETNDYAAFIARGDDGVKAMTKEIFAQVHAQMAPRLEAGYATEFFGEAKQRGQRVLLWKMSFVDGSDDLVVGLSLKDDRVTGFRLY